VQPLDVLAQQIAAEVACGEWDEDALYDLMRGAYPYRDLTREQFTAVVNMLAKDSRRAADGGRRVLHRDAVNRKLRPRQDFGSPQSPVADNSRYRGLQRGAGAREQIVGTVNEDFAVESIQATSSSSATRPIAFSVSRRPGARRRCHGSRHDSVLARRSAGRTDEVSAAVSRLRDEWARGCRIRPSLRYLTDRSELPRCGSAGRRLLRRGEGRARIAADSARSGVRALLRRAGGTQLVIHSPFGSRINRAWGWRCASASAASSTSSCRRRPPKMRSSLAHSTHSFQLDEVARYLHANSVRELLVQALLDAPMFMTRWRWNAPSRSRCCVFSAATKCPRNCSACRPRI
jgi:ATP-dependent Lhr-like helicase